MSHNQFCPIAKAMDLLGEKWTMLLIRELLLGGRRFGEFQRGLPGISPTLLTKRLVQLEEAGLILKKRVSGQRSYEYFPTRSCEELFPVLEQVGTWGMRWARSQLTEQDFDVGLLMLYMERSIDPTELVGKQTVLRFNFSDVEDIPHWWIVVSEGDVDVCIHDPGKEVDVYFNTCVRTMAEVWMGDISYKKAISEGKLQLVGPKVLTSTVQKWLKPSLFHGIAPATEILASA